MRPIFAVTVLSIVGFVSGCANRDAQAPPAAANIRKALGQSGLKDVSVAEDRDKGVVTLGGHVAAEAEKSRAEQLARSMAANEVVANEIAILPPNDGGVSKTMYSDLDKGIDANLDAALIGGGFRHGITHTVKNGVITLKGSVDNEDQRTQVEKIAQGVPNTQQVVNELNTTHTKATSTR